MKNKFFLYFLLFFALGCWVMTPHLTNAQTLPMTQEMQPTTLKNTSESFYLLDEMNPSQSTINNENVARSSQGTWGTVPWVFASDTGILTFGDSGNLGGYQASPWNRSDSLKIDASAIKKLFLLKM